MEKKYAVDVKIDATVYVYAETIEEAQALADGLTTDDILEDDIIHFLWHTIEDVTGDGFTSDEEEEARLTIDAEEDDE